MCTLSVQLYSYVISVNLVFVFDKIINSIDNFTVKKVQFFVLFSVFKLFYLILKNMSTDVRKFYFSLLYLTLVTSRIIC